MRIAELGPKKRVYLIDTRFLIFNAQSTFRNSVIFLNKIAVFSMFLVATFGSV
jgi:hypothetical protein